MRLPGLVEEVAPAAPVTGNAYVMPRGVPLYLPDALAALTPARRSARS